MSHLLRLQLNLAAAASHPLVGIPRLSFIASRQLNWRATSRWARIDWRQCTGSVTSSTTASPLASRRPSLPGATTLTSAISHRGMACRYRPRQYQPINETLWANNDNRSRTTQGRRVSTRACSITACYRRGEFCMVGGASSSVALPPCTHRRMMYPKRSQLASLAFVHRGARTADRVQKKRGRHREADLSLCLRTVRMLLGAP
jgi:hypothetical protein